MKMPFVSVIIPTYQDWSRLQLCLAALENQTYPKDKFEILVVNNNPQAEPPLGLVIPDNCRVLKESRPGSYAARNQGISVAKGVVFAFTDSDCLPSKVWLEKGVTELASNPGVDRLGGAVHFVNTQQDSLAFFYEVAFGLNQKRFVETRKAAVTANMFSKQAVFSDVGFFDESLMSGGDVEWGERAFKKGYRIIFSKEAAVRHPARSVSELIRKAQRTAGGVYELEKRRGWVNLFIVFFVSILPPFKSIYRAIFDSRIPFSYRFKICFLRFFLRYVSFFEMLRVHLGKRARRS